MADYTSAYTGAEVDENLGFALNGAAKAWVNFNGTGTIAERDSYNVSSLTDNGTGYYTVNFTDAFAAADYCFTMASSGDAIAAALVIEDNSGTNRSNAATTSFGTKVIRIDNNTGADRASVNFSFHGDLA